MDENFKKELEIFIEDNYKYKPDEKDKQLTRGIYPTIIRDKMFVIELYEVENGKSQIKNFLINLKPKIKARALKEINLLEEYGNELREPYSKYLGNKLFELRIIVGNNISRIIYFFYFKNRIILTNGFMKKQQKTPKSEIELALKYKEDWIRRNKDEV